MGSWLSLGGCDGGGQPVPASLVPSAPCQRQGPGVAVPMLVPLRSPLCKPPNGGGGPAWPFPERAGGGAGSLSPPASCRAHEEGKGTEWLSQYKQPGFALPPTQAGCWPSGPAGHMD